MEGNENDTDVEEEKQTLKILLSKQEKIYNLRQKQDEQERVTIMKKP